MAESSTSQYEKILQAPGVNTRKYWLVEVIENDCIVTPVGVYDEILPEPSSRHNTVTISSRQIAYFWLLCWSCQIDWDKWAKQMMCVDLCE